MPFALCPNCHRELPYRNVDVQLCSECEYDKRLSELESGELVSPDIKNEDDPRLTDR
jgi:hypothetical protein